MGDSWPVLSFCGRSALTIGFGVILCLELGCGVKGKPLPPIEPVVMGRGGPSYSGVGRQIERQRLEKERSESEKKE